MADRFYCEASSDAELLLDGSEAHHLSRVLRLPIGHVVEVFDGQGRSAQAVITAISKRDVKLTLQSEWIMDAASVRRLTLVVAPPKGDRLRWLIEKATEIGVHRLIPLKTERTVVTPRDHKLEKLRQTSLAACKQCGRNRLLQIDEASDLQTVLKEAESHSTVVYGGVPHGDAGRPPVGWKAIADLSQGDWTVCIGPEGGFTDSELQQLETANAQPLVVGQHVLRIETASIAVCSLLLGATSAQQ